MKILFVGNSYTYYNEMPIMFSSLAKENGKDVTVNYVTRGGRYLCENLEVGDECRKDILKFCEGERCDVLIIQEQSCAPITSPEKFERGVGGLIDLVGAERNILYVTWGRKPGNAKLGELKMSSDEMYEKLKASYYKTAEKFGCEISDVGTAFQRICSASPETELYNEDKSHPSAVGSAVAAFTHYKTVFKENAKKHESLGISEDIFYILNS